MSNEVNRVKARYATLKDAALREAALNLEEQLGTPLYLSGFTTKAQGALADTWPDVLRRQDVSWDWREIFRKFREFDRLDVAIWTGDGDRLAGLGLCTVDGSAITIRFIEGDPRPDCPLKGLRSLIILECASCYAQGLGKEEIRAEPVNERLASLYVETYGFEVATPRKGSPYYRKKV